MDKLYTRGRTIILVWPLRCNIATGSATYLYHLALCSHDKWMELATDSVAPSSGDVPVYKCAWMVCELYARVGVYLHLCVHARRTTSVIVQKNALLA